MDVLVTVHMGRAEAMLHETLNLCTRFHPQPVRGRCRADQQIPDDRRPRLGAGAGQPCLINPCQMQADCSPLIRQIPEERPVNRGTVDGDGDTLNTTLANAIGDGPVDVIMQPEIVSVYEQLSHAPGVVAE